jgi:hypothetical protein
MENAVPIFGNPSWSAQALPDGRAFITVTYPPGSDVAVHQTLRLPMEDLPELARCLNDLAAWKPAPHHASIPARRSDPV